MRLLSAINTLFLLFFISLSIQAKEIPPKPDPYRLVNDYTQLLNQAQSEQLERKLRYFEDSTSTQIVVIIQESLDGDALEDYTHRIAEKWGIGQKGKDNGALLFIALKDKKLRIEVGYGLEPVITDAASFTIINSVLKPAFRKGNFYNGIDEATSTLMSLAAEEFSSEEYVKKEKKGGKFTPVMGLFVVILIIILIVIAISNRGGSGGGGAYRDFSRGRGIFFFPTGGGSNFGSGGGGFGGFGGGSFGGGSFGGGGASGGW